jgi:hypothetical protein
MKRRLSLEEIRRQDEQIQGGQSHSAPSQERPPARAARPSAGHVQPPPPFRNSEIRSPKSEFIKVSVTLPPDVFEQLEDLSRLRRKARQPYTVSALVRQALDLYFRQGR